MAHQAGQTMLAEIHTTGFGETTDHRRVAVHSQIPPEEGEFLQRIVRLVRPSHSLEIGMAYGISTLYLCDALAEVGAKRHTVIDPYQFDIPEAERPLYSGSRGWEGIGSANVERAGYTGLVRLITEKSEHALPRLLEEGCVFEFAFIDGFHTFEAAFLDWYYVDRMLSVGGVIVFDDLGYPSLRKLIRFLLTNREYAVIDAPVVTERWIRRTFRRCVHRIARPDVVTPDATLGIDGKWVALRKQRALPNGDGSLGSRRWDAHVDF